MPTVVGVKLRYAGKTLFFDPAGNEPAQGDQVVVSTARGQEMGQVVQPAHEVEASDIPEALKPVVRVASDVDIESYEQARQKEREAKRAFRELVGEREIDMKPIDVELLFDGSKMVFYFSAEERVDFRDLVKDLAARFHVRVEMRQVGVRDEARMVGGIGHCGEELCCARVQGDFQPVSIRMAKEQDLPLNPLKISGVCGRLMCCLRYEYDAYKDFKGRAPKKGSMVETPKGPGKVIDLDTPREVVGIRTEDGVIRVPLEKMDCCKGTGCPCRVPAEALETVADTSVLDALEAAAAVAAVREQKPAEAEKKPGRSRRNRGGRGRSKSQGGAETSGKEQGKPPAKQPGAKSDPAPKQPAKAPDGQQDGQAKAPSGRRRRRRRPSRGTKPEGGGGTPA